MKPSELIQAPEALALAMDTSHPDHVAELAAVMDDIRQNAAAGKIRTDLSYFLRPSVKAALQGASYHVRQSEGRGGQFTRIEYDGTLGDLIQALKDAATE